MNYKYERCCLHFEHLQPSHVPTEMQTSPGSSAVTCGASSLWQKSCVIFVISAGSPENQRIRVSGAERTDDFKEDPPCARFLVLICMRFCRNTSVLAVRGHLYVLTSLKSARPGYSRFIRGDSVSHSFHSFTLSTRHHISVSPEPQHSWSFKPVLSCPEVHSANSPLRRIETWL